MLGEPAPAPLLWYREQTQEDDRWAPAGCRGFRDEALPLLDVRSALLVPVCGCLCPTYRWEEEPQVAPPQEEHWVEAAEFLRVKSMTGETEAGL